MISGDPTVPMGLVFFMLAAAFAFHMASRPLKSVRNVESPVASSEPDPLPISDDEDETMDTYVQEVLPLQAKQFPELVRRLQETAQRLAANGSVITSDDVHAAHPIPQGIDPRIMGSAFIPRKLWRKVGYTPSTRKETHSRPIARWQLKQEAA